MGETQANSGTAARLRAGAVVDAMLRFIELDTAFSRLVRAEQRDLVGQSLPDHLPHLEAAIRMVLTTGRTLQRVPLYHNGADPVLLRLEPLRTARGTIAGVELSVEPGIGATTPLPAPSVRDILDSLFAFVGVLLPDGTLIEANRAALEAADLVPEDVIGKPFPNAFWWSYDPAVQAQLRDAIARAAQGETVRYDVPVRLARGRFITIDFMLAPARDAAGRVQYLIPSATDVSERTRIEAALLDRQRHLSLALTAAQMGTWEIDLQTGMVQRSPSTDRLFGFDSSDRPRSSDNYFERIHPDDVEYVREAIRQTIEAGAEHVVEYRVVCPDGSVRWLSSRGELIRDDQGTPRRLLGALLDVSERQAAAAALQASEARFRATFEHAPLGIAHLAIDGRWLRVNERLCMITGYPREELLARTFQSITHPDDLAVDLSLVERLLTGAIDNYNLEKRYVCKDGSSVWVNLTVSLVQTTEGAPDYFIAMVEDISQRKAVEAELRFQAQLLDAVGQGVIATDFEGIVRYWNRFAEHLYGWSRDEALGHNILDLTVADLSLQQGREILEKLRAGMRWTGQYFVRRRDGGVFPVFVSDVPLYGADGSVTGIVGISADISEQLRLEAEREELLLREREVRAATERNAARIARLQVVTAALSEALTPVQVAEVIVGHSLAALGAAAGALRLVSRDGNTLDSLYSTGMPLDLSPQAERVPLDTAIPICVVARTGQPLYFADRVALYTAYPQAMPLVAATDYQAFALVPLSIERHTIGALALAFDAPRDFSEEDDDVLLAMASQAAQAIERARLYDVVREAVEARDTLIAVASHDLRAPITALVGQAQLLERRAARSGADERTVRAAQAIAHQAQQLNRMVNALLDLSRIQSGQLTIDVAPLDLAVLTGRVLAGIKPGLSRHTLECSGETAGLWVAGDELRLEHVLYNLIGNAVKYSPHGGTVRIHVTRQKGQACVAISDQGLGVPAAAQARLFERFYRAANVKASGISGMGIGLYAVREIMLLHNGTIDVVSAEGVGSTFTICLPLAVEPGDS